MTISPLTVETAEITTAAVEIKTLTVRGKQVTLAVFRQLEEKRLVLDDGTLAGTPWGRVNYHPDKCGDDADHTHVVWQDDTQLRRSRVYYDPVFLRRPSEFGEYDGWITVGVANKLLSNDFLDTDDWWIRQVTFMWEHLKATRRYVDDNVPSFKMTHRTADGLEVLLDVVVPPQVWRTVRAAYALVNQVRGATDDLAAARAALADHIADLPPVDECRRQAHAAADAEAARRERHRATRQALAALPQLFIAT